MADLQQQHPTFEDLELLVKVSELLALHSLGAVMQEVIDLTKQAVGAQKASLFLLDGRSLDWDYLFTVRDLDRMDSVRVVSEVMDKGLAGWVYRHKQGAIIADTQTDPRWHVFPDDTRPIGSAMCVPLIYDGEVLALLTLDHPDKGHFSDYQMRLMSIITNQATVAISNAQLFHRINQKQKQMEAMLHAVPDVLFVTDENGLILRMNGGAVELLGAENEIALIGKRLSELDSYAAVIGPLLDGLDQMQEDSGHSFEVRSEKFKRDYKVSVSRWSEPNADNQVGYVIVMVNVTTLHDLFRFKDEMLRIISHDLRSPLAIIEGYNSMIELDTSDESPLREHTHAIKRSVTRMTSLLDDLLQVRKIDEQGLQLQPETIFIDLLVPVHQGGILAAYQKQQQVKRDWTLDESVVGTVDSMLLRQAMENYVGNAIKYTPVGGTITLRAYVQDQRFYFEVQDNGIGIPKESIPRLFESFYRVNKRSNMSISGTGLGLSLVKSIVERHRGEVWVTSEIDKGSTFGLWVPLN